MKISLYFNTSWSFYERRVLIHKRSILSVDNKRYLLTCCFLSANGCIYLRIGLCQSFETCRNTAYVKQLHTVRNASQPPVFGRMFPHFKLLSHFVFISEVFSFLFRSPFDGFCSTARESGVHIDTTQQVPVALARTQTQHRPRRCFSPSLPASLLHVVDADHPRSSAALILLSSSSWRRWQ